MRFPINPARPFGLNPYFAAGLIWVLTFLVVVRLWLGGVIHSISWGVYATAGQRWLEREPLYDLTTIEGFQYFPQSAMLVAPLSSLGSPTGDIVWRALGWGLLALGTVRFSALPTPSRRGEAFFIATCLSIGPAVGPLGNGQANLLLAALTLNVAADVATKRWWRGALIITLGVALKPLMAVLLLLVWALYRPMTWRIPIALALMFVAPWVVGDHTYVIAQYRDCLTKLSLSSQPGPHYEDLRGLLATLGWVVPHDLSMIFRVAAAVGVLALCGMALRRAREPYATALVVALASVYLMLFNPRTQSTTYAIPGAIVAVLAAFYLLGGRRRAFFTMVGIQIALTLNYHYLPFIELWLKPLACIGLGAFLVHECVWPPPTAASEGRRGVGTLCG